MQSIMFWKHYFGKDLAQTLICCLPVPVLVDWP